MQQNKPAAFRSDPRRRLPAIQTAAGRGGRRLRQELDPFSTLDVASSGCRPSALARKAIEEMTTVVGPISASVDRYLDAASCIPPHHLRYLRERGCLILMAPTIAQGLDSELAARRRGRCLTRAEFGTITREYDPEQSRVVGLYEPELRLVVLPTAYSTEDPEFQVVHELGHALTIERIGKFDADALLKDLPGEIQRHIAQRGYEERENKVAEVLAEGYAWIVVGREGQLPPALISAVFAMLPDHGELRADSI